METCDRGRTAFNVIIYEFEFSFVNGNLIGCKSHGLYLVKWNSTPLMA
jgi:hypothetical protein